MQRPRGGRVQVPGSRVEQGLFCHCKHLGFRLETEAWCAAKCFRLFNTQTKRPWGRTSLGSAWTSQSHSHPDWQRHDSNPRADRPTCSTCGHEYRGPGRLGSGLLCINGPPSRKGGQTGAPRFWPRHAEFRYSSTRCLQTCLRASLYGWEWFPCARLRPAQGSHPASPFLPHDLLRCCWFGITVTEPDSSISAPVTRCGHAVRSARRCPVTNFCLLPQWQRSDRQRLSGQTHTHRRNLLSEKLSLNFKYLTLKKRLTVQMYDMQLHSVKIDSEILPDRISHEVLQLWWQTVQQRCSRKN